MNPIIWILFIPSLVLSFVLSGMEAGVFALSRLRVRQQMRAGKKSARVLHRFLEDPENFLWTIFIGNTAANFFILGIVIMELHDAIGSSPALFILLFLASTFLFYAFFDLLPKMLFRTFPNRTCMALARPFRFVHLCLRPLVSLAEWVSRALLKWTGGKTFSGRLFGNREELLFVMQDSELSSEESAMIRRVLDVQNITVRQIATPMSRITTLDMNTPMREALKVCRENKLTRVPVWEHRGNTKRIGGLLNLDALLFRQDFKADKPVSVWVTPALYFDDNLRVELALRRMQRSGQRIGIVLNHERREIGVVTLRDIFKVMFGEVNL
jgi:putative hemolysin